MSEDMSLPQWDRRKQSTLDAQAFQLMSETRQMVVEQEKRMEQNLEELKEDMGALRKQVTSLQQSVLSLMEKMPEKIVERIEILVDDAFPEDPDFPDATPSEKRKLHRRAHAKKIQEALESHKLNRTLTEKFWTFILDKGLTIVALALAAYFGFKVS